MSTFMFKNLLDYTPVSNIFIENICLEREFVRVYLLALKCYVHGEPGVNSALMASTPSFRIRCNERLELLER